MKEEIHKGGIQVRMFTGNGFNMSDTWVFQDGNVRDGHVRRSWCANSLILNI